MQSKLRIIWRFCFYGNMPFRRMINVLRKNVLLINYYAYHTPGSYSSRPTVNELILQRCFMHCPVCPINWKKKKRTRDQYLSRFVQLVKRDVGAAARGESQNHEKLSIKPAPLTFFSDITLSATRTDTDCHQLIAS